MLLYYDRLFVKKLGHRIEKYSLITDKLLIFVGNGLNSKNEHEISS